MKITGENPDGSLVAKADFFTLEHELYHAQQIAKEHGTAVHFEWNTQPIAVAEDTDLNLIMRQWESREPGAPMDEIGPYPDPATTPAYTHGTLVVEI